MAAGRDTQAGARSGITFDVTLEVPWNAPETHIQLNSVGVFELEKSILDVFGLCDRRPDTAVVRITQGQDDRSVSVLVPDPRVLDRGFHDITIIDMGDAAELAVSEDDLSLLRRQWPVSAIQSDLDDIHSAAKKLYRHSRPGACTYCGKYIKCDIYCHVLTFHLDLEQLWRVQCRGAPCGRARHRIAWTMSGEHTMSLLIFKPPASTGSFLPGLFGVRFGLMPFDHAMGVSTDVLLFSQIHLSLVHHYMVFHRGLPHFAFRRDYLDRMCVLVSQVSPLPKRHVGSMDGNM